MNQKQLFSVIVLFFGVFNHFHVNAQETTGEEYREIFLAFDEAIGEVNTSIYSGVEYIEKHRMINENHKFFQSRNFIPATVFYDNKPFFNIPLKYNILEDLVIISPQQSKAQNGYSLFENKLKGFVINGHRFVNVSSPEAGIKGIYELLYQDEKVQLLKKYRVKEKMIRKDSYVHYEFNSQKPVYLFFHGGEYRELTRKNLLEVYPDHKEVILDDYRKFRKQSGEQRDQAAVILFKSLSQNNN